MKKQVSSKQRKFSAGPGKGISGTPAQQARTSWTATARKLFAIDPRSLAVFRMAVGVLLLADLATRATDLKAMYSDEGMFPRALIRGLATSVWNWSFHFGSGSAGYQAVLFGIAAVLAVTLLAGFQTRLATIGSWLMVVSIHHRVPPILSGAEILLRMLLFWAMFVPLGRVWSVDRWLKQRREGADINDHAPVISVGSAAILSQMAVMYLMSAILKCNPSWFRGEAIAGSLAHDFYGSPAGRYLLQFPQLVKALTWGAFALEWAAPFLLFCPRWTARVRLGIITALATMHAAIAITMEVGLFSHVAMAGLTLFLPAEFWNSRLWARLKPQPDNQQERGVHAASTAEIPRRSNPPKSLGDRTLKRRERRAPTLSYVTQGLCMVFVVYALALAISNLPGRPLAPLALQRWRFFTRGLGLSESWGMFGAAPSKDGWYIAGAKLKDGSVVDLLRHGAPLDPKRPDFPARLYPNYFWQKLFREMSYDDEQGFQLLRRPVAEYLCRDWNAQHSPEKQVVEFELIFCMQDKAQAKKTPAPQIFAEKLVRLRAGEF